ncbi:OsmC family protein [Owenweeksia hongkongensis]|uniref:OsmC family protein n=1 Tax=Owenweeksia hongkongensis TaxID=253245 RepID=UPI003A928B5E
MKISLERKNDHLLFEGKSETGNTVTIDGSRANGGDDAGMSPMELLLTAVAACASFDVSLILKKQRQDVKSLKVDASGTRPEEGQVKPFKTIHLHFKLTGTPDESKVARAVELAVEKYCSVASSLDPQIKVTHDFSIEN